MSIFGYQLAGKNFIANVAVAAKTEVGIEMVNRNPRKWRLPPDAYSGTVEEAGPRCDLLKVGDNVTIQRWSYLQLDIDDERMHAHQDHVLLVNGHPVNGVLVLVLVKELEKKSGLILLETAVEKEHQYCPSWHGIVYKTSVPDVKEGDHIWIKKSSSEQWKIGKDKIIFRWDKPETNEMTNIMAIGEKLDKGETNG